MRKEDLIVGEKIYYIGTNIEYVVTAIGKNNFLFVNSEGAERIDSLDYSVHYDVVTFFDSLEHFDDINWISNINCDYIVISVPYCHYLDTMDDKDLINWKHLKPNEHLYHFNIKSLISHFSVNGYEPISMSNIEDSIRKSSDGRQNIITGVFCKM